MLLCLNFGSFILLLTGFELTYGRGQYSNEKSVSGENDFDLLIFTQHWPETVCSEWRKKSPSHRCFLPRQLEWTIHGIWPTKYHQLGPSNCNKTLPFDESTLLPIIHQLDDKWINIEDDTPHFSFWRHEWDKHGTCAAVLDDMNTELKYFRKGLDFLNEYDMTHVLAKANIIPGGEYPVQDILNGVQKILGKTVEIQCISHPETKQSYLFEIRICLDKQLALMDCDQIVGFPTNCSKKKPVNYPSGVPTMYNVIMV